MRLKGWSIPPFFTPAFILTLAVSALVFMVMYTCDNKYTAPAPAAQNGVALFSDNDFAVTPVLYLLEGWELYKGELLTPATVREREPDEYVRLGEYKNMAFGDSGESAHGEASYRMVLDFSRVDDERILTLQIPEIYSSYRLYVNGELALSSGVPEEEGYDALILTREYNFRARDSVDLLFAVADRSHYYGGMLSAPAVGDTLAVNTVVQSGLVFRAAMSGAAIMLGLIVMMAGMLLRRRPGVLFLALCLSFVGFTAYTIVHALFPAGMLWFRVETVCYYAMFFLAIWLIGDLCGIHNWLSMAVKITDAAMCVLALAVPLLLSDFYWPMYLFYKASYYYKLFLLLYLSAASALAMLRGVRYAATMLCGLGVFWAAVIIGFILPERDPIIMGTYTELGCFVMLVLIGGTLSLIALSHHRHSHIWLKGHYEPLPDD